MAGKNGAVHSRGFDGAQEALRTWVVWISLAALAPGWALWLLTREDVEIYLNENRLQGAAPIDALPYLGVSTLLMAVLIAASVRAYLRSTPKASPQEALCLTGRCLRPVIALPLLVSLRTLDADILSILRPVLIAAIVVLVASGVHAWRWPRAWRPKPISRAMARTLSMLVVAIAAIGWTVFFARLGWMKHWSLNTLAFDLGIYDNILWNTMHGRPLACSIIKGGVHTSAHFDPILILLTPIYALAPRAETLISIQAVWIASGVIPLYRLAMIHATSRSLATLCCLVYLLHPSLHGIVLFDFHSFALLIPLALWAIERLEAGRFRGYFAALAGILLVREDAALFACGLGLWALLRRPACIRIGLATLLAAVGWLVFVKLFVMPDPALLMTNTDDTYTYANRYGAVIPGGEGGVSDIVVTLVTNPMFVLRHVLVHEKVISVVVLLLPLCFLPLLAGALRVTFVYGFAFTLLASHPSIYYPYFHYMSPIVPVLLAATPAGLVSLLRRCGSEGMATPLGRATSAALIVSSLLCALEYGAIVENRTFRLHTEVVRELSEHAREQRDWVRKAAAQIPAEASVSVSNRLAPHVTNRRHVYLVQQAVETDYIFVHKGDLAQQELSAFYDTLRQGTHRIVDTHGLIVLAKRR